MHLVLHEHGLRLVRVLAHATAAIIEELLTERRILELLVILLRSGWWLHMVRKMVPTSHELERIVVLALLLQAHLVVEWTTSTIEFLLALRAAWVGTTDGRRPVLAVFPGRRDITLVQAHYVSEDTRLIAQDRLDFAGVASRGLATYL